MRRIKRHLFLLLFLAMSAMSFSQLNEFLIQWYLYDENDVNDPWRCDSSYFDNMKNYNLNSVFFARLQDNSEYPTFLNKAKNAGLSSVIVTHGLNAEIPFNITNAKTDLETYNGSIDYNVIGYHIKDEPYTYSICDTCKGTIEQLPEYINTIEDYDPQLLRYANLLPCVFNVANYDQLYRETYIQEYINTSHPNILSFDVYPIYDNLTIFFNKLYDISLKSVENSIPFIYALTPYQSRSDFDEQIFQSQLYPAKTINQFNYCIYGALMYGAKGLSYWPGLDWVIKFDTIHGAHVPIQLIDVDSTLNKLTTLHGKILDNSDELLSLNFASVYHISDSSTVKTGSIEDIHGFCSWAYFSEDKYADQVFSNVNYPLSNQSIPDDLAVSFLTNKNGQIYFWLFNKNINDTLNLSLDLRNQSRDVLNGQIISSSQDTVTLDPGEAKLFTSTSTKITSVIDSANYSGFNAYESASNIYLGEEDSVYSVVFDSTATKSFVADTIRIINTKISNGSTVRLKAYKNCNTIIETRSAKVSIDKIEEDFKPNKEKDYLVYPNPFTTYFNIRGLQGRSHIYIYDITGQLLVSKEIFPNQSIETKHLSQGVYILKLQTENDIFAQKIIKR